MTFRITHDKFEGPLDVLLDMIEDKKLSINEISLSQIAGNYFQYVREIEKFPKEEVADFLVMATTLMLIKSRSLIPMLELSHEEEEDIQELETRLKMLKTYRLLSKNITDLMLKRRFMFSREYLSGFSQGFYPPESLKLKDVVRSLEVFIEKLPKLEKLPEKVIERIVSIEEKMSDLIGRITRDRSLNFKLLSTSDKGDLIVSFLALLELFKQGIVAIHQKDSFGEIEIVKNK